jgi:hypothetical protein
MLHRWSALFVLLLVFSTANAAQPAPSAGVITGRVVEEGTNTPIADARVMVMVMMTAPAAGQPPPQPYQANSGSDGTFRFEGLPPGRYRLSAQKTGYATQSPGVAPPALVTLQAGGAAPSQIITLQRGGVIAGRVLSPTGEPMVDARVMPMRRPPSTGRGGRRTPVHGGPARDNE